MDEALGIERLIGERTFAFPQRHFLSAAALSRPDAEAIQEASIKATGLREPFGSLWLRLMNRRDAAGP